jgi:hypothetical protein
VRLAADAPRQQAIVLELTQMLSEHLMRDVGHRPLQIVEAPRLAVSEQSEDQRLPLAADNVDRQLDRAGVCVLSDRGHCSCPFDANAPGGALTHVPRRSLMGSRLPIHLLTRKYQTYEH